MKNLLLSAEQIESKRFYFRCEFFIETWFLNKNWIQKLSFWKIFLPEKMIIRNVLYSKSAGTKNSQFKTWHFGIFSFQIFIVQENVCFRIWFLFFWEFLFKLWFSMKKFATKSCLLKWARKVKNLLLAAEQIESKRFFFRCEFFIETCFLNKNWIQKLSFWKIFLLQNMIIRNVLYSKSAGTKNSQFKTWHFGIFFSNFHCAGKLLLQNLNNFSLNVSFQTLIFNEKVCYKVMLFF